ncbi:HAD hydrolase-like protein [Patescibacteria group bacterium]|nr:HAD hydrolase-like protein [Patescibacteria group bacterium]MBU1921821.1 HAD hydrolase-like protein [Patescibacteria group bacterium]
MASDFLQRFKYGIFDQDGTLVDSMPAYAQTFAQILDQFGIDDDASRDFYRSTCGTPLPTQFKKLLENNGFRLSGAEIQQLYERFFKTVEKAPPSAFQGVKQMLHELRGRDMSLFVTTGTKNPQEILHALDLGRYFLKIMGTSQIDKGPEHIHEFAKAAKVEVTDFCSAAFLASDGPADMALARKMCIYPIGVAQTVSPDLLIRAGAKEVVVKVTDLLYL